MLPIGGLFRTGKLFLLGAVALWASIMPALAANDDAIAVIIGNKAYGGKIPEVSFAHNDAEAMKRFVIEVLGYREGNVIDLRDATGKQLEAVFGNDKTHEGKLFDWIRPGDSDVTVFYSGHGVPGLKDKRAYLLPVDDDANRAEITGYPVDTLYRNLARLPAKSIRVFIDACFSGETPKGMVIRSASGLSVAPKAPKAASRLVTLTAAGGDQLASWDEEAEMGLFTKHLLEALYGAADAKKYGDGDGKVSLAEVGKYLDREMSYQARRRFGREQKASLAGKGSTILALVIPATPKQSLSATPAVGVYPKDMMPGTDFKDCLDCPVMVMIPRGSFMMGSKGSAWTEKPVHRVNINYLLAVGKFEVTQAQWRDVVGDNPSHFKGDNLPVEKIYWDSAQLFLSKLNARLGMSDRPDRYRLLSESEWEYVVRAGTKTKRFWGDSDDGCAFANAADITISAKVSWWTSPNYRDGYGETPASVGRFEPNAFGLHDTLGNVWEWVEDCWNDSYANAPTRAFC